MADIKAFRAIRPAKGLEEKIAALPYDVYSRSEAKEVVKNHKDLFLNIDRAETQFDDSVDIYADCVYEKARELLWNMFDEGKFVKDEAPCYYIYQLEMDGRKQTGLVACCNVDDYINNTIKKHENTRADKEVDRIRHVDTTDAQTGPIFLAYRKDEILSSVINRYLEKEPACDFTSDDGIAHRVYVIDDSKDIDTIKNAFDKMNDIYIADGHHRAASAIKVALKRRDKYPNDSKDEEYNYFLSVLFPDEELKILDYNRVLKEFNGNTIEQLIDKLSKVFDIKEALESPYAPKKKGQFGLYLDHKWYVLDVKKEFTSDDSVDGLDVSILQKNVLETIFSIDDPKTDNRIQFVGGIRGLKELEDRVDAGMACAFSMYPTSIKELFAVADENRLMPPKSTWFEPKLRSGLFIHDIRRNQND